MIRHPIASLCRFGRDRRGTAAIEAALAVPFMVVLASGVIELGTLFYNEELIQTGVRDAARYLAHVQDPPVSEDAARNLATRGTITSSGSLRVSWWQPDQVAVAYEVTPNPVDAKTGLRLYRGGPSVTTVRVSTTVPYRGQGLLSALGLAPVQVTAAHEERHVGD